MKFKIGFSVLCATSIVALGIQSADAASKKKPVAKSSAKKTIHTKDLHTALKGTPGRTTVPVASDGDFAPSAMTVKMKPTRGVATSKARAAQTKLPSRNTAGASRPVNMSEPVSTFFRVIRAGRTSPTPSLAMGQALAVNDSYVVTSADFVSDTWTNAGDARFFVNDSLQPLSLVGFDLGSNLAVFYAGVGTHMEHTLPLGRLRFESPVSGEDYSSLGLSGLIGGARRLRPVQDLTFVRERFELPASVALGGGSAGGSGGVQFLFDKAGRWMGSVSLLDQRDGRRFDVTSANQAYEMIRAYDQKPTPALSAQALQQQAVSWQERWTNTFFDSVKKNLALRALDCEAEALHVDDQKVATEIGRTRLMHCANAMPVALTRDYAMGVELVTGDVSFTNDVKTYLAADTSTTTAFGIFGARRAPASINVMTGYECSKNDVVNSRGHHMHVRFCTSALKNVGGLNDTTIAVVSSDTGVKSTLHSLHLRGFEPKNAKRFMEWMIETETIQ